MIDSVTLHIQKFVTYSLSHFGQERYQNLSGDYGVFGRHLVRFTNYPQQCKAEGRYFPQVQIVEQQRRQKGGMMPTKRTLVVQVSLPKLVYGTNIFDINEHLVPVAAAKLKAALEEIRIGVSVEDILSALVYRLDYSKILQVAPSFGTTDRILRALSPYNAKQSSDFTRSNYHEGRDGYYLKYYNSSQGFVVYDKFDEIVTNGKTKLEQEIARQYKSGAWTKGALRLELSLQKKTTVDMVLRRYCKDKKKDFTLLDVSRVDISRACLLDVFERVYVKDFRRLVRMSGLKDAELVRVIHASTADYRERAAVYYLAHRVRERGLKAALQELRTGTSTATVGRYKRIVEKVLKDADTKKDAVDVVSYVKRKLEAFQPVLPKQLQKMFAGVAVDEKKV
jgi:hypothetical protein